MRAFYTDRRKTLEWACRRPPSWASKTITGLTVAAAAATLIGAPALPCTDEQGGRLRDEARVFACLGLWFAFGTNALIIGATFAAFSYRYAGQRSGLQTRGEGPRGRAARPERA
ncbi:hypothetical protein [Sinosporangium siamense]|uniref:Uncharacterized protein n=1 Tax=Sinosporangium siamense TaxID=1367973 RepID=A0A919VF86_9ACTN|nr:hypothetical protein [Sinosporangium siamense]GII95884.1 hypothetical protein Ssi02_61150 [Sinosporangium siamense]